MHFNLWLCLHNRLDRLGGTFSDITVSWQVVPRSGDVVDPATLGSFGSVVFPNGMDQATLNASVLADNIPELAEYFTIRLLSVSGGAHLATTDITANLTVPKNDDANGVIGFSSGSLQVKTFFFLLQLFFSFFFFLLGILKREEEKSTIPQFSSISEFVRVSLQITPAAWHCLYTTGSCSAVFFLHILPSGVRGRGPRFWCNWLWHCDHDDSAKPRCIWTSQGKLGTTTWEVVSCYGDGIWTCNQWYFLQFSANWESLYRYRNLVPEICPFSISAQTTNSPKISFQVDSFPKRHAVIGRMSQWSNQWLKVHSIMYIWHPVSSFRLLGNWYLLAHNLCRALLVSCWLELRDHQSPWQHLGPEQWV